MVFERSLEKFRLEKRLVSGDLGTGKLAILALAPAIKDLEHGGRVFVKWNGKLIGEMKTISRNDSRFNYKLRFLTRRTAGVHPLDFMNKRAKQ